MAFFQILAVWSTDLILMLLALLALLFSISSFLKTWTSEDDSPKKIGNLIPDSGDLPKNWVRVEEEEINTEDFANDEDIGKEDLSNWGFDSAFMTIYEREDSRLAFLILEFSSPRGSERFFAKTLRSMNETGGIYSTKIGDRSVGFYLESHKIDLTLFQIGNFLNLTIIFKQEEISEADSTNFAEILEKKIRTRTGDFIESSEEEPQRKENSIRTEKELTSTIKKTKKNPKEKDSSEKINKLSKDMKRRIRNFTGVGMSTEEIAERLGLSRSVVNAYLEEEKAGFLNSFKEKIGMR